MYPYHVQRVHLRPGDFAERLNFCKWLNGRRQLHRYIMFTDEAQFTRDGVNNTHNSRVWCAVWDDQLIGPFILEGRLTGEAYLRFLQEELPRLLDDVPLNKRDRMYFQHEGAPPHSSSEVRKFLNYRFPGQWIGRCGPHDCQPGLQT